GGCRTTKNVDRNHGCEGERQSQIERSKLNQTRHEPLSYRRHTTQQEGCQNVKNSMERSRLAVLLNTVPLLFRLQEIRPNRVWPRSQDCAACFAIQNREPGNCLRSGDCSLGSRSSR